MAHNSLPVYRIPAKALAKAGTEMRLYIPLRVSNSRQSDMAFAFYSSFCKCAKRGTEKNKKKKTKKLNEFVKSNISGTLETISLKFGMWSAEVGGSVHSKNRLV